jgi:long-subunit acyl-CoA synthetase (AMP-forming)
MTTVQQTATIGDMLAAGVAAHPDAPALRSADGAVAWTWREYRERVAAAAAGLAGLGVGRGDTVALWLANRPEFHVADAAAVTLGAAPFSVYQTFTAEQAEYVIGDAGSRVLITEPAFLESALAVRDGGRTALELIVLVEGGHTQAVTWAELLAAAPVGFDLRAAAARVEPGDLATLIYTSGTTGAPKGVELTHANVVAQCRALRDALRLEQGWRGISWLPMAHVAERLCTHYLPMLLGWSVTCLADPRAITATLREVRPQIFFSPPRLWEKLRAAALAKDLGLGALGLDAVALGIVGAAPCPPEVVAYFNAAGLPLSEVYGMSETTGVATVNPPDAIRAGTVGTPLPGVEVRLSDTGEVLMRGPVIMRGYRNRPEATAEALDADGWLHSGDVGVFDEDGHLRIVDRIKELIISAAGKNMSPANIEATVKSAGSAIGWICIVGDARPYNVALVTIDPAAAEGLADPHSAIAEQIARGNERLARVEQVKRYTVLEGDWTPGGDELTPTSKLRRKPIERKHAEAIEALYSG